MADPTFNGVALVTRAARTTLGSRQVRMTTETMPGVDGVFVQPLGSGGRKIEVAGLLTATAATSDYARRDVLAEYAEREALADGRTVADFADADQVEYANCLVAGCAHGALRVVRQAANVYTAYLPVTVQLLQLTP